MVDEVEELLALARERLLTHLGDEGDAPRTVDDLLDGFARFARDPLGLPPTRFGEDDEISVTVTRRSAEDATLEALRRFAGLITDQRQSSGAFATEGGAQRTLDGWPRTTWGPRRSGAATRCGTSA